MQEKRNSSVLTMELRLSCINPSIWYHFLVLQYCRKQKSSFMENNDYFIPPSQSILWLLMIWLCFYQTRSAWSMDQGSNRKDSAVHNFAPTVTKFCVMWEGQALPHDTKFSNCRCEILGRRVIFISSLIPGSSWSGLIKAEPGDTRSQGIGMHDIVPVFPE